MKSIRPTILAFTLLAATQLVINHRIHRMSVPIMAQHTLDAEDRLIYLEQQFVPMNTARISIFDYGYNYGMGVYDVARVEQGASWLDELDLDN